ncbi:MAG: Nitroreductase family protein [Herbinix sp.]|jgi:nitroreductase|nr:Nitroreductase family protein [Herbinix sp.]
MDLMEAIHVRSSRRTYLETPISQEAVVQLKELIETSNRQGNLSMKLIQNETSAFGKLSKSYGMFRGVRNYILLIGKNETDARERLGYYGERVVLLATQLGLGTCWVGGTFDRSIGDLYVQPGEFFSGVITIGNVERDKSWKERLISKVTHRKTKAISEMIKAEGEVPEWFLEGMRAVQKAPSAVNAQPVTFTYQQGVVSAYVTSEKYGYEKVDLGIAKLHFEIGAGGGSWELKDKGVFHKVV